MLEWFEYFINEFVIDKYDWEISINDPDNFNSSMLSIITFESDMIFINDLLQDKFLICS